MLDYLINANSKVKDEFEKEKLECQDIKDLIDPPTDYEKTWPEKGFLYEVYNYMMDHMICDYNYFYNNT